MLLLMLLNVLADQRSAAATTCGTDLKNPMGITDPGEGVFPWHVTITYSYSGESSDHNFLCIGTIVSESMVVTAAHCVNDTSNPARYRLIAGLKDQGSVQGEYSYNVAQIIRHPAYLQGTHNNDIALLLTDGDILFTANKKVLPICLPRKENEDDNATVKELFDKKGYATGWGMNEDGTTGSRLKCGEVGELDVDSCREQLLEHNHFLLYNDAVFCARAPENQKNTSVCFSDQGGGLSVYRGDRWYLWGIASVASQNTTDVTECDLNAIVGFTAVENYTKWIVDNQNVQKQTAANLLRDPNCGIYQNDKLDMESANVTSYQYPWNALLELKNEKDKTMLVCGGVLIHKRFVLTISHCLVGIPEHHTLTVRLGAYNVSTTNDTFNDPSAAGQLFPVERVITNPHFDKTHYDNNLALVQLKYDVDTTKPNIKHICLPSLPDYLPTNLTVTGWLRNQQHFPTLQRDSINNISAEECRSIYEKIQMELPDAPDTIYGSFNGREKHCDNYNAGSALQYVKLSDQKTRYFLAGLLQFNYPASCIDGCETFVTIGYNASWIYDVIKALPASE
ncbi:serine protease 53-like [Anopheles aquasalis]|uniref:serine protease 53-like n=1 Tax=Anopheles aquasalis TaxID=42839 RepID=UPI00215A45A0|nr:serine protease 53-like [Anopheles aquasalis]